jgi:acetate kinase
MPELQPRDVGVICENLSALNIALESGCSVTAVREGKSIDNSMD